jgi:hypothetical protein
MTTIKKTTALLVAALTLSAATPASAQHSRGRIAVGPRPYFYAPYLYNPYWAPYGAYYYYYPYVGGGGADVKMAVTPKQAEVFVDGYYAGVVGDFNGVFSRLRTSPGGHVVTLHLDGYRTVSRNIYVRPGSTFTMHDSMDRLPAGEMSAPVPEPMLPPTDTPDR